ncbi:MAG: SDR family oxidoreductase, partial [Myxococcota bacterium]
AEVAFVTGFPAFTARRMIRKLLEAEPKTRVVMLAREKFAADAAGFREGMGPARRRRLDLLIGDVTHMHLGLAGDEYRRLTEEVTRVYHLASIYYLGAERRAIEQVNVGGTRNVLELAEEAKGLRRLLHFSTCHVSGDRRGVVMEDELELGQRFRNPYEETKYEAERLVRGRMGRLPITVVRPGIIVGDSKTGEIDRFDGPYYLMVLIVASPVRIRLPLPGRGSAPLHVVPIDYVIDAAHLLARDDRAASRTFHLVDPCPLGGCHLYDLVAKHAERQLPRHGAFPVRLARALLKIPGLERLGRAPLAFLESLDHQVFYNSRGTLDLLAGSEIACPPFDAYVDNLIRYVREVHETRKQKFADEVFDPLD